jgi:ferredoxin
MMDALRDKAREMLASGACQVVIGYEQGSGNRARACFVRKPEDADRLIMNDRCEQNLAVYLTKHEVRELGKPAVVAKLPTMRAILQLAAESQLQEGDLEVIGISPEGELVEIPEFKALEDYVNSNPLELTKEEKDQIEKIEGMSRQDRWNFWTDNFTRCLKCYACRAACPLCYCSSCVVQCNRPQWIPVPPHGEGNLDWHVVRAMHLAGRCVNCGDCARACPMDIPLNFLTQKLSEEIFTEFGLRAGTRAELEYALSTYKPEDQEDFIR